MGELTTENQCIYAANVVLTDITMTLVDKQLTSRDDIIATAQLLRKKANLLINIDYELSELELLDFVKNNDVPYLSQRSGES